MTRAAPLRILISSGVFAPHAGGAESLFGDLGRELVRQGHDVTVITRRLPDTPRRETLHGMRIERFRYPVDYEAIRYGLRYVIRTPPTVWRLFRLMRRQRVQTVVIGLLDMSALYLLRLRERLPFRLVLYLHGGETRDLPRRYPDFQRLLLRCLGEADRVVAVSSALARDAEAHLPSVADRIEVIPNGIDTAAIDAAQPERRARPYMLIVGRLVRGKRVDTVLTAFANVCADIPDVDLVVAGDGPERMALLALADRLGIPEDRVQFAGTLPRERVFGLMKGALLLVHASESEGDPIVALEARAAGRLLLAARATGLRDAIVEGVHGAFFDTADAAALGRLMLRFASSAAERAQLEKRIAAEDRTRYDIRSLAERHLNVIAP